jgi:peptide/nickel transport system substrate-binding protein
MPDTQTAVAALEAGEIDFYETPPADLFDQLTADPAIELESLFTLGLVGYVALNWLYPPFDNIKCRQAMLHVINQDDMLRPTFAEPKWYQTCGSYFTCGSEMENDANAGWFKSGPNPALVRQLMAEGGYDGRPIVVLQASNYPVLANAASVLAQQMRGAGMNVDLQAMDFTTVSQRRASQNPPERGGWNVFFTTTGGFANSNPYMQAQMATSGKESWFGWPTDARNEELRMQWMAAETLDERKVIAAQIQENAWNVVPHLLFGQWKQVTAHRRNVTGWLHIPALVAFWNVQKS